MTSAIKELIIQDTDLPLLTPTIINQQFIEKSGNQIPFSKLIQLNVALDALQPTPPNANTVWFDNTILLQDASMTSQSLTINPTSINSSGNITIDPSNDVIVLGNLNMSGNDIQNVKSIEIDSGSNNAVLSIDGSGNLLIDPSLNLVIGSGSSLTLQPTNNLSTTLVPYGLYINSPSIKTYPTTASFSSYPAYYTNFELGTSQTINDTTPGGFNFVIGDYRNYTKSAGTTSDIERLYFNGFQQSFNWTDANTCKQYIGFSDNFTYSGKDANGRISSSLNANTIFLNCPLSSSQTITNVSASNRINIRATNSDCSYNITNSVAPNLLFTGSATNVIATITNHTFLENSSLWDANWTGAGSMATITNMYGLRLNPPSGGTTTGLTITNNWGVYQEWGLSKNYFAGNVGIGTTSISNALDVSGNATISTSLNCPLIKNTGGTIEINGTQINLVSSDSLTFNFGSTCQFQSGSTFQVDIPNINLNSGSAITQLGDVNNTANGTNLTIDDGGYRVNTNAIMMTAYNGSYILPICYTKKMSETVIYIGVNNIWKNVYQEPINGFPNEFFNRNNTFWDYKIEFSINLRNVTNPTDKALALYFEILDAGGNVYTPFLYNQTTPFTRLSNASTYTATSDMLTFTWTDYISLTNSIAPALTFSLWWYGDMDNVFKFDALLSLTRTNLV